MTLTKEFRSCVCGLHDVTCPDREYLTLQELASRWKVSPGWIYKNRKRIGIPSIKPGGQVLRFPLDCLLAWEHKIQSGTVNGG